MVSQPVDDDPAEQLSSVCKVLSDKTRLALLLVLSEGPQDVSTLWHRLGLPQPTASHHLNLLRMSGLVVGRRKGKQVFYELRAPNAVAGEDGSIQITVAGVSVSVLVNGQTALG